MKMGTKHTNNIPHTDLWREVFIHSCDEVINTRRGCYEFHIYDVAGSMNAGIRPCCSRKGDLHRVISIVF